MENKLTESVLNVIQAIIVQLVLLIKSVQLVLQAQVYLLLPQQQTNVLFAMSIAQQVLALMVQVLAHLLVKLIGSLI